MGRLDWDKDRIRTVKHSLKTEEFNQPVKRPVLPLKSKTPNWMIQKYGKKEAYKRFCKYCLGRHDQGVAEFKDQIKAARSKVGRLPTTET